MTSDLSPTERPDTVTAPWLIRIDFLGRPLLANQVHQMHWAKVSRERKAWRDATAQLAAIQHLPAMKSVAIEAWAEYPSRRSLPDPDGISPAVKGAIDGLVQARILTDDKAPNVASVTYLPPVVVTGKNPALVLSITDLSEAAVKS